LAPEHRRRIGIAIWEFAWLIDRQFKPKNGGADNGLVLNGEAITGSRIAADLGLSIRTVQRNLETLEAEKYIRAEEIPGVGKRYFIANPKRWQFSTHDRSVMGSRENVIATHDRSVVDPRQKCLDRHDRSVMGNKELDSQDYKTLKPTAQPSAGGGVSASQRKPKKAKSDFDVSVIEIPDWLPRDAWREFVEHRREMKNSLTERAAKANIKKLSEFRSNGQDPRAVIEQTIAGGWTGLFEVKSGKNALDKTVSMKLPADYVPASERIFQERSARAGGAQ
jgi:hypothetical protein